jgi:tetratricopeptide (TPR) repeat protein
MNPMMQCKLFFVLGLLCLLLVGCASESVEELRAKGRKAYDRRDYAEAREYYLRAITEETTNRDVLLELARAYRQDYMFDSAMYYLKRADLLHPLDRELNEEIREVAIALGDYPNAISAVETLARIDDDFGPYHAQLADLWVRNGHEGRAFYHARRALLQRMDNPAMYLQTANWAAKFDSMDVAFELLDSAIAIFGPLDQFVVNKALYLSYVGKYREAEKLLRPVVERDSPPNPSMQLNLANVLANHPGRVKREEALRIYEEIRPILAGQYPIDSLIDAVRSRLE